MPVDATTFAGPVAPDVLMRLINQLAGGSADQAVSTFAPFTGEEIARYPYSTERDVVDAFTRARGAQKGWAATPIKERFGIILRFHDLLLERQDEVLDLIQTENGKSRRDAFLEITDVAMVARYYARTAGRLLAPRRRRGAIPFLTRTMELRHPKGVVTVLSPWNYPLSMAVTDALPALLAGNAVVQKPDTQTALTAVWARELMLEAGLPKDVWTLLVGDPAVIGDPLLDHADYVMFTGSTAAGRRIAGRVGERLVSVSLELGGKNAMLVLPDADLNRTVEGAVAACFPSSGQLCVAAERLYVHADVLRPFVDSFVSRTRSLKLNAGYSYATEMGSLTNSNQLDTTASHVAEAVGKGATLLTGGQARPDLGPLFYEPTILTDVTSDMALYRTETFGPVVSIYAYSDLDHVIDEINDSPYGLNASVWTRNSATGRAVAARIRAGTVGVNDAFAAAWGSIDAPMGGMGDSGLGRRHGADGLLKYTEVQTVAHQRLQGFSPPARISYEAWAMGATTALKVLRRLGLR